MESHHPEVRSIDRHVRPFLVAMQIYHRVSNIDPRKSHLLSGDSPSNLDLAGSMLSLPEGIKIKSSMWRLMLSPTQILKSLFWGVPDPCFFQAMLKMALGSGLVSLSIGLLLDGWETLFVDPNGFPLNREYNGIYIYIHTYIAYIYIHAYIHIYIWNMNTPIAPFIASS